SAISLLVDGFIIALTAAAGATNQFNAWARALCRPRGAAWLPARGLIVSRARHGHHHPRGHAPAHCMTTVCLNPLAVRQRVFVTLDRLRRAVGLPVTRAE